MQLLAVLSGHDDSTKTAQSQTYAWVLFKHPLPVIPNLRVEYVGIKNEGKVTGVFKKFTANGGASLLEMKQYDIIPYYNILDNTAWITLDLGIDVKLIDFSYNAETTTHTEYTDSTMIPVPMLYARGRVELPLSGLAVESDIKYVSYSSTTIYDARAKIDYTFDITPVIQSGIELGYRIQHIESEDLDDLTMNLDFKGVYAGVMLRF